MEIIDSHCHYWEPERPDRPYDPKGANLGPPVLVEDLIAEAKAAGVTKLVQVTPSCMGWDNRYSFEGAERYPNDIAGVFIRFDPFGADMAERLAKARSHPKFWGVRHTLHPVECRTWLADGVLDPFLAEAGKTGVVVALQAPHHAKDMLAAARRFPQTLILVDHMALRSHDPQPFTDWAETLDLAAAPNVYIKVSYFPEVARTPWPYKDSQERFKELLDRFGPDRLIWGSNVPPSKKAATYKQSVDFTLHECAFLSASDKEKIFAGTFLGVMAKAKGKPVSI